MASRTDFVLPGLAARRNAKRVLIYTLLHAYSSMSNRRKLENHLYAFWSQVLSCLVDDIPGVVVVPQYNVFKASENDNDPDSSSYTISDNDAEERYPDFALLGLILADRETREVFTRIPSTISLQDWPILQVAAWKPFTVFEIKRMAGRHFSKVDDFNADLLSLMNAATKGAEKQARVAFDESASILPAYTLDTLILIAAAGEWWCFRIANATEFEEPDAQDDFLTGADEEDFRHEGYHKTGLKPGQVKRSRSRKQRLVSASEGSSKPPVEKEPTLMRWSTFRKADVTEEIEDNYKKTSPKKGVWSGLILFGTPESNQRLFLIHEMLENMLRELKPEAQARVDRWMGGYESEESSDGEDPLNFLSDDDYYY